MKSKLLVALILLVVLGLAVVGQVSLPAFATARPGVILLGAAAILFALVLFFQAEETRPHWFKIVPRPSLPPLFSVPGRHRALLALAGLALAILTFYSLGDNRFTPFGFGTWLGTILCFLLAFAQKPAWGRPRRWHRTHWALLGILLIGTFYRFYRLNEVPVEFGSDQVEKLLDIYDVLSGRRPIFFPRNTGREAIQFYWTAFLVRFTPLELNFTALKVGTGIFSVLTLPFVFLLGRELFGRQVGLLSALLVAISHWHIAITRIGLRFVFTAAFFTPTLYFLIRAFRHNRRNDWIAAGTFLGIGLHTYIPMRIVPVVLVALVAIKVVGDWGQRRRPQLPNPFAESSAFTWHFWQNALVGGLASAVFFLPLFRYAYDYPQMFWLRASSRLIASGERINYWQLFWQNSRDAWLMFNYRGDSVYANNLPHSPMLDDVTAALFVLGLVYLLWQLLRYADRRSLYVLVSMAIMLLPSILSFNFTGENPSAVRTGGAIPVVMITAALPLWAAWHYTGRQVAGRFVRTLAALTTMLLLAAALYANFNWYFVEYDQNYRRTSLNHSELAFATQDFIARGGKLEDVYHIAYPYWTDTRVIAILNGQPYWNQAIHRAEDIARLAVPDHRQLFLLNVADADARNALTEALPQGQLSRYYSTWSPDKDFFVYETSGSEEGN